MNFLWSALPPILLATLLTACVTTTSRSSLVYRVKVKQGESLAELAHRYDTTWQSILQSNGLERPDQIRAGMELRIEPGPGGLFAGTPSTARAKPRKGLFFGEAEERSDVRLSWPVRGRRVTSGFGLRNGRPHEGVVFAGSIGDPVYAAAAGVVEFAARNKSYGKTVVIRHQNLRTLYAHLDDINVDEGDEVEAGAEIGEIGKTGHASGPHLHFEVRDAKNRPKNPMHYLPKAADQLISQK